MATNSIALPIRNEQEAHRFFCQKPKLREAYESLELELRELAAQVLIEVSAGYGELRPANQPIFRLFKVKTYCEIHLQRNAIKVSINLDLPSIELPATSLKPIGIPKPHGNDVERFIDYKIYSSADVPDILRLLSTAYRHWSTR